MPSLETLEAHHDALSARVDRHDTEIAQVRAEASSLLLWRAEMSGRIAGYGAIGALVGGLVSLFLGKLLGLH